MTETEILHLENRETGEFAHRETTKVKQTETFNGEVCVYMCIIIATIIIIAV